MHFSPPTPPFPASTVRTSLRNYILSLPPWLLGADQNFFSAERTTTPHPHPHSPPPMGLLIIFQNKCMSYLCSVSLSKAYVHVRKSRNEWNHVFHCSCPTLKRGMNAWHANNIFPAGARTCLRKCPEWIRCARDSEKSRRAKSCGFEASFCQEVFPQTSSEANLTA